MKWRIPDLRWLTLFYLALPTLIFAWGWFRPLWALLLTGMLIWGTQVTGKERDALIIKPGDLFLLIGLAGLFAWLSGMGGFIPQEDDYLKHNQLWQDLVQLSWPIGYTYQGEEYMLSYYLGYYLPPALFSKVFGGISLPFFSYCWGMSGLLLVYLWAYKWIGRKPLLLILLLMLFGGQDVIWRIVVEYRYFLESGQWGDWHWDEMGLPYEAGLGHKLPTHFGALSWAPQHVIPGMLAACIILHDFHSRDAWRTLPFVQALTLLWSPFVGIGMGVFVLVVMWQQRLIWIRQIHRLLPALLVGLLIGLYFLAHQSLDEKGWIWEQSLDPLWPVYLVFFGSMKFIPLFLLVWKRGQKEMILSLSLVLLALSMFYWMGHANDFYMRVTIPAWFILSLFLARELLNWDKRNLRKWLLLLWFIGGSLIPLAKITNHAKASMGQGTGFANTRAMPHKKFIQIKEVYVERGLIGKDKLWDQYVGDPESLFAKYLSKPIVPVATPD